MDRKIKITVFFPVHNEENSLPILYENLDMTTKQLLDYDFEILFINDCSTDNSLAVIRGIEKKDPRVMVVNHDRQRGQAGAIDTGLQLATGDIIVFMDADLQAMPEDIPKFIDEINRGFDAVNGIRIQRKATAYSIFMSQIYNIVQCFLFNLHVNDVSSTFMAVRKEYCHDLKLKANDHRYIVPIMARRGARISEACMVHGHRKFGKSKYSPLKFLWAAVEVFAFMVRLKRGNYDLAPPMSKR